MEWSWGSGLPEIRKKEIYFENTKVPKLEDSRPGDLQSQQQN
jgi:hypothetical protein